MSTVEEIRHEFVQLYLDHVSGKPVEVAGTLELIGSSFMVTPVDDTIFGAVNRDYVDREAAWYLSQSRNVNDIPGGPPKIWRDVASSTGEINSNYGWTVFSEENGNQHAHVLEHLVREPEGRRAVMIYTRPSMHVDWNRDGMRDFMCTSTVNYYLRDGRLHSVVQMRSNDAVTGFRNDLDWQRYIQWTLCNSLGVMGVDAIPGNITWQAGSLHMYARNYWMLEHYIATGKFDPPLRKVAGAGA